MDSVDRKINNGKSISTKAKIECYVRVCVVVVVIVVLWDSVENTWMFGILFGCRLMRQ